MTPAPRLVIGIGCWNEAEYLHQTIPAILAQSMPDFRVLILDNGSTDATADILHEYAEHDSRISLLYSPVNLWPPVVGNRAWSYVLEQWPACRWILGGGADDVMGSGYLAAILEAADRFPYTNCIYSPVTYIGHPEKGVHRWPTYDPATVHAQPQIPGWRAITTTLWQQVGPENTDIRIGADWEWAVRASALGVLRPLQLAEPMLALRVRPPGRLSQSAEVNWPQLHRTLCSITGATVPAWAQGR